MSDTFKTIAKFQYSAEALIVKGRLEAEGVQVFLTDNHTIDTDPLVSNAIGGVKLKVLSEDVEKSQGILDSIQKYSVDDEGQALHCPYCNSEKIELYSKMSGVKAFFWVILGFLASILPLGIKHKYICEDCKTEFAVK
ncbi:DUF2007 domain-containing protein [Cellulophaga sp. F20128]|uniref:DUF2007 domain-containing protein n=1 Tax=Cellulophaga sp. F20128 TaxID=2926413 RepID=UPI001FF5BF87|nr:DUF2007 domain-containing protein [Cellulophaga sp. F20128]MCK0157390.1 DUF2007 domain-containing protein [Cellulophaga sp. F20128]